MNVLFEHALQNLSDSDMVGITIQYRVNQNDKIIGISLRRKNLLSGGVIWSAFERDTHSHSRFNVLDTLLVTVYSVRMPVGLGRAIRTRTDRSQSWHNLKEVLLK